MFPSINPQQDWQLCEVHEVLLLNLRQYQRLDLRVVEQEGPSAPLHRLGGVTELLLELVYTPEILLYLGRQLSGRSAASALARRGHVGPEEREELVSDDVEAEVPQHSPALDLPGTSPCLLELVEGSV